MKPMAKNILQNKEIEQKKRDEIHLGGNVVASLLGAVFHGPRLAPPHATTLTPLHFVERLVLN